MARGGLSLAAAVLCSGAWLVLPQTTSPVCRGVGRCQDVAVGASSADSYSDCLKLCQGDADCHWFTFFGSNGNCVEFANCTLIDLTCADCLLGHRDCAPSETVCGESGACFGHFVASDAVQSEVECLEYCQAEASCQWYSFYRSSLNCVLTEDCPIVDDACADCTHGEKSCRVA
jgi:hypothetical protein